MRRNCPLCRAKEKTVLYRQDFHNKAIALMEKYDVAACRGCGFTFADNIPAQGKFDRYYAQRSKYEFQLSKGQVSPECLRHFSGIKSFLRPYLYSKDMSILDVGCSTGALLNSLKKDGFGDLAGLDPSGSCVKTAQKLYGIKVFCGSISGISLKRKYDLIILSAVLEHFVVLSGILKKIRHCLKPGGLLFVEVPDASRFWRYVFAPFQQFSIEHINYFSYDSLKNLMREAGFEMVAVKKSLNRINQSTDPDILGLFKKTATGQGNFRKDRASRPALEKYINLSRKLEQGLKRAIAEKLSTLNKVVVWGTGTLTQSLLGKGLDISKVLYFVDSNPHYHGKKLLGREIKPPQAIKEGEAILISTWSYHNQIQRQIRRDLKLKNKVITIYE